MLDINKKNSFTISILLLGILIIIYFLCVDYVPDEIYTYSLIINTKLIIYGFIYSSISFFILLFFSDFIFQKWFNKFFKWYILIVFLLLLLSDNGTSYTWFSRADLLNIFGIILIVVTLIFALIQKFIYKNN